MSPPIDRRTLVTAAIGTPLKDFWCRTGSMAESFAKLGDSIT